MEAAEDNISSPPLILSSVTSLDDLISSIAGKAHAMLVITLVENRTLSNLSCRCKLAQLRTLTMNSRWKETYQEAIVLSALIQLPIELSRPAGERVISEYQVILNRKA